MANFQPRTAADLNDVLRAIQSSDLTADEKRDAGKILTAWAGAKNLGYSKDAGGFIPIPKN